MTKTEAARILAQHLLTEAVERLGANPTITDQFAKDVVAEAATLHGTRWDLIATAADARPAFSRIKAEARAIIGRAQTRKAVA